MKLGSYGNVTGERGRDQGTQAACHSREFGLESSTRQGGSVHGRTYSDVSSGSVGGPWKRTWRGRQNTGRVLGAGAAHAETLGSFMGLVGGSGGTWTVPLPRTPSSEEMQGVGVGRRRPLLLRQITWGLVICRTAVLRRAPM